MIQDDLKKIGTFLVTELTTELVRKQKKSSGKLLRSFESKVTTTGSGYEIAVWAASYFKFINEGVNGKNRNRGSQYSYRSKMPPLEPLLEWVRIKSIATGNKEVRSAAFAIQRHVYKNGTKGINIIEEILRKSANEYTDKISSSMVTKMSLKIDTIIKDGNNN